MPKKRKARGRKKKNSSSIMGKVILIIIALVAIAIIIGSLRGCTQCTNPSHQPRFGEDGSPDSSILKSMDDNMIISEPNGIHFYMESSGSMNGFLRGGVATEFKKDVWRIMNYYTNLTPSVNILTTDNNKLACSTPYTLPSFQNPFNNGGFVSAVSTNLPEMIKFMCNNVDVENDVAVFISDMQYDPVGAMAPAVLQAVFSTDIANIFGQFDNAVSLVGALSDYVYRDGTTIEQAPYYFVIFGKAEKVASIRNDISAMLSENEHFIDNIETGFNYKTVRYDLSSIMGCQINQERVSFHGIESGNCSIELTLHLDNYRWNMCNKELLSTSLTFESENGCSVKVDSIYYDIDNIDPTTKSLKRKADAHIALSISGIAADCDIIKWKLEVPAGEYTKFAQYYTTTPNNPAMTYSLDSFIKGMFKNGTVSYWNRDYNYIHLSKK